MPRLELVIRQLLRAQFGRRSERIDPAQFQLTLEKVEQEIAAAKAAREEAQSAEEGRQRRRAPAWRNLGHDQIVEHIPELQDEIAELRSAAAEALAPVEPDPNAPDADETDDGTFPGDKPNLFDA